MKTCNHGLSSNSEVLYHVITEWHGKELIDDLVEKYKDEQLCCDDLRKMGYEFLINYIKIIGLKRTNSEEKKTERYKIKYKSTLMERYGVDHVSKLDFVKEKKNETYSKTYGSFESYIEYRKNVLKNGYIDYINSINWNEETKRRKNKLYEKYGVYNVSQIPMVRSKISEKQKLKFKSMTLDEKRNYTESARNSVTHRGGFRSKLEVRIEQLLKQFDLSYETNITLFGYNYDFLINEKIILEINGDMWHGNPKIYSSGDYVFSGRILVDDLWEKDDRKSKIAIDNGYKILVLWESDIKSSSDEQLKIKLIEILGE